MSERFLDKIFQAFEDVAVQQEQSAPIVPADGDDYTYKPPLIPAQWVPVTEYHKLVKTSERLSKRVAALEQRLNEAEGEM